MGVMDVCNNDDSFVDLHILKLTKVYIVGIFLSMHTN